jgi:hypothetical protein
MALVKISGGLVRVIWSVLNTSEDGEFGRAPGDTEFVILIGNQIIFIESGNRDMRPTADGHDLSFGKNHDDSQSKSEFSAKIDTPTIEIMENGLQRNSITRDPIRFIIKHGQPDVLNVKMYVNDINGKCIELNAQRIDKTIESKRLKALLDDPGFECAIKLRGLLEHHLSRKSEN